MYAMWLNHDEIWRLQDRATGHPILEPAAYILVDLVEWVDNNSDGWSYWDPPARAATKLMALLVDSVPGPTRAVAGPITAEQVRKACTPIKAFGTKHKYPFPQHLLDKVGKVSDPDPVAPPPPDPGVLLMTTATERFEAWMLNSGPRGDDLPLLDKQTRTPVHGGTRTECLVRAVNTVLDSAGATDWSDPGVQEALKLLRIVSVKRVMYDPNLSGVTLRHYGYPCPKCGHLVCFGDTHCDCGRKLNPKEGGST